MNKHDRAYEALKAQGWAEPLLRAIDGQGGIRSAPAGLLFELRFALELSRSPNTSPTYEFNAGVGGSTVDFHVVAAGRQWLIELLSVEDSDTVSKLRAETHADEGNGVSSNCVLLDSDISAGAPSSEMRKSPWAELLRVSEKLESKIWDSRPKSPCKFPNRGPDYLQVLIVDMSGFEGTGDPDAFHCREIAYGSSSVPNEWRNFHPKTHVPILGLFDPRNLRAGAIEFQKRVDAIGFVSEHPGYEDDEEIGRKMFLLPHPEIQDRRGFVESFPVRAPNDRRDPLGMNS